jgi:DNA-binding response OmpR family regulator
MGGAKKRILLVDDEHYILKLVGKRLQVNGYDTVEAEDGEAGLKIARESDVDLIVLDLMMPKMNGYQVCGALKQDSQTKKIPIVLLTAKAGSEDVSFGTNAGADAYVTKPFKAAHLLKIIDDLLNDQPQT